MSDDGRRCSDLARLRARVRHGPEDPDPDEHQDEEAQDPGLIRGFSPARVEERGHDDAVQDRPGHGAELAGEAIQPEELADLVGR
jgi:hypothetical protein